MERSKPTLPLKAAWVAKMSRWSMPMNDSMKPEHSVVEKQVQNPAYR